jgi:putative membrane protein
VLSALGSSELTLARVARDVSQNEEVLRYAGVLIADHQGIAQLLDATSAKAGGAARDNAAAAETRAVGDSIANQLTTLPVGFNNTWVEEQIKAHERTLAVLDTAIIPSVTNPDVRKLLDQLRPTLVTHMQRGMQILSDRRRQAAERGDAWVSGFQAARPVQRDTNQYQPSVGTPSQAPAPTPAPAPAPAQDTTPTPTTTTNM